MSETSEGASVPAAESPVERALRAARDVQGEAYAPYSRFRVGAALVAGDGRTFTGCNVENASLGLTLCAERAAVVAAVSSGVRRFVRLALVTDSEEPLMPCGACRQVLAEFGLELEVVSEGRGGARSATTLAALLPDPFTPESLPDAEG